MSIKQTAGKILLALYALQRENPVKLEQSQIVFQLQGTVTLNGDDWLIKILHDINTNDSDLYNSINYLLNKSLVIRKNSTGAMGAITLRGISLTDVGIDVIEGIEQGEEPQKVIKSLFNFTLSPKVTVDSLVKAEVGNIVGIGVAASGKVKL